MKLLILACLLGLSVASFHQQAAPTIERCVQSVKRGMDETGSLKDALGFPHLKVLDDLERFFKDTVVKAIRESLIKWLKEIKDRAEQGEEIALHMLEKLRALKESLKNLGVDIGDDAKDILEKIKQKAKDVWEKLHQLLEKEEGHLKDVISRFDLKEILHGIIEKLVSSETIAKIRDYIRNIVSNHPFIEALKQLVEKLKDGDFRMLLKELIKPKESRDLRALGDWWKKIKDFFEEKSIILKEKFAKFGEWMQGMWDATMDKLKNQKEVITALANKVINHAKDLSEEVARQALDFFNEHKQELTDMLWQKLREILMKKIGQIGY